MSSGIRYKVQRERRRLVKAEAAILLDRILSRHSDELSEREVRQIAEMRLRLQPPTGVKVQRIATAFLK